METLRSLEERTFTTRILKSKSGEGLSKFRINIIITKLFRMLLRSLKMDTPHKLKRKLLKMWLSMVLNNSWSQKEKLRIQLLLSDNPFLTIINHLKISHRILLLRWMKFLGRTTHSIVCLLSTALEINRQQRMRSNYFFKMKCKTTVKVGVLVQLGRENINKNRETLLERTVKASLSIIIIRITTQELQRLDNPSSLLVSFLFKFKIIREKIEFILMSLKSSGIQRQKTLWL